MIAVFTGITALAAIVTATLYGLQISVMDKQLDVMADQLSQMEEAGKSDSVAWQKQLEIMQGQLTHVQKTSHLEQRAWVGLARAKHQPIEPNKPIQGEFVFLNTGKTPAIIITAGRSTCFRSPGFNFENLADIKKTEDWMEDTRSQGPLPPNASITLRFSTKKGFDITESLIKALNRDDLRLYVIGRILYQDIFSDEHETCFCFFADPNTNGMNMAHQYNYMD